MASRITSKLKRRRDTWRRIWSTTPTESIRLTQAAGGLTPVDTDGDGIADYRDTDSDNDGRSDRDEAGHAGLAHATYADPNGGINDPATDLADTFGTSEVDYREAGYLDSLTTTTTEGGLSINQDGGNDVYLLADDGSGLLSGLSSLTFEHRYSTTDSTNQSLVSYTVGNNDDQFKLVTQSDGDLYIEVANQALTVTAFDFRTLADGNEHAVAFSWDNASGDWVLYVDGAQVDSGGGLATGLTISAGGELVLGNEQESPNGGFDVNVAHQATLHGSRFFDDVRTANEIAASYRSDLPYDEANMIANWRFDHLSTDGIVTDAVSGNNLTVKHTSESGFTASEATLTFGVDENAIDGTVVGSVTGVDAEREALIASLLAADPDCDTAQRRESSTNCPNQAWLTTPLHGTMRTTLLNGVGGSWLPFTRPTKTKS